MNGVPILINEGASAFRIADFLSQEDIFFDTHKSKLHMFLSSHLPTLTLNVAAKNNFRNFKQQLLRKKKKKQSADSAMRYQTRGRLGRLAKPVVD